MTKLGILINLRGTDSWENLAMWVGIGLVAAVIFAVIITLSTPDDKFGKEYELEDHAKRGH